MHYYLLIGFLLISFLSCQQQPVDPTIQQAQVALQFAPTPSKADKERKEKIADQYIEEASQYGLYSPDRQAILNKGLAEDSTIALLWQQKAMPLYKQGKHELGKPFLDKAVYYDKNYLSYRGFMSCIFARHYEDAIKDFEAAKELLPGGYEMDHSYDFYIALSYLQLNQFEKAEAIFKADIERMVDSGQKDLVHHLDLFYYGISKYEQAKYEEAIKLFDWALELYPEFSDVQAYKAFSLGRLDQKEEARTLFKEAKANGNKGFTINEDNTIYERYPYQIRWHVY